MRPGFGEQTAETVAEATLRTPKGHAEILTFLRTGTLPRPPLDYDLLTLTAILYQSENAVKGLRRVRYPQGKSGPAVTGDPIVDEWERRLAAGEDLDDL